MISISRSDRASLATASLRFALIAALALLVSVTLFGKIAVGMELPSFDDYAIDSKYKNQAKRRIAYETLQQCVSQGYYWSPSSSHDVRLSDTKTIIDAGVFWADVVSQVHGLGAVSDDILDQIGDWTTFGDDGRGRIDCDLVELSTQAGQDEGWIRNQLFEKVKNGDYNNGDIKIDTASGLPDDGGTLYSALEDGDDSVVLVKTNVIGSIVKEIPEPKTDNAAWYMIWDNARSYCGEYKQLDNTDQVKFPVKDGNKYLLETGRVDYEGAGHTADTLVSPWGQINYETTLKCSDVTNETNKNVNDFVNRANEYLENNSDESDKYEDGQIQSSDTSGDSATEDIVDQCQANLQGFGWLICPAVSLASNLINNFYNWIDSSLNWTLLVNSDASIKETWQKFLNIANVIFAIAFMVMIYSMATSAGILSNYEIKKMLPRLIVLAIGVNTSFYICGAMVDISNICGRGLHNLLSNINPSSSWHDLSATPWDGIATGAIIAAVVLAAILFFGTAIIALITILAAVIFRQMALIILVVVSPIAFALYTLPNTSKWAKQWLDLFGKLLLVYPMFGAVWGASQGLSGLLVASSAGGPIPPFIFSVAALMLPAFAILPLFKMSGGLMAFAAGSISGAVGKTGLDRKLNGMARGAGRTVGRTAVNNPLTRGAAGVISRRTGRWANTKVGRFTPLNRALVAASGATAGFAGSKVGRMDTIDQQAIDNAKALNATLTPDQLKSIAITGQYTNKRGKSVTANDYQIRSAMADSNVTSGMSLDEQQQMIINNELRAQKLEKSHQQDQANRMRKSTANAVRATGTSMLSAKSISDIESGALRSYDTVNKLNAKYASDVADNYTNISATKQADMTASQWRHLDSLHSSMSAAAATGAFTAATENSGTDVNNNATKSGRDAFNEAKMAFDNFNAGANSNASTIHGDPRLEARLSTGISTTSGTTKGTKDFNNETYSNPSRWNL